MKLPLEFPRILLPLLVPVRVQSFYHFEACLLQSFKAAQNRRCVVDSFYFEISHRTGASMLGRSRTVGDNRLIAREFIDVCQDFVVRD